MFVLNWLLSPKASPNYVFLRVLLSKTIYISRGMLTAVAGFFGTLYSLSSYVQACSEELPDKTGYGDDIDWAMGPGFNCLLVATIIKPIDFIAHLIVPVVKPENNDEEKEPAL